MKSNKQLLKNTIPVNDLLSQTPLFPVLFDIFISIRKEKSKKKIDTVKLHKEKLGNETVFSPEHKMAIWNRKDYVAKISNMTGVHIEVDEKASLEDAKLAVQHYIDDMGLQIKINDYIQI